MNAYVFPNIWLSHGLRNFIETQRPVLLFITINNNKRNSTVEFQLLIGPIPSHLQIHQPVMAKIHFRESLYSFLKILAKTYFVMY